MNRPAAFSGCGGAGAAVVNAAFEQQIVELVNYERHKANLPPLKRTEALDRAARYHSSDLGQDNYFKHDTFDGAGGSTYVCSWSDRITGFYPGWNTLAENIAAGQATPVEVMMGWLDSDGHRANILGAGSWEIGVGYFSGRGDYGHYWVQDFGRRDGVYPLIINREAATTLARSVQLYVYGSWSQVRVRVNGGGWSGWQPFQNSFEWMLPDGSGMQTIEVEMANGSTHASASDSIRLERLSDFPGVAFLPLLMGN